jgi:hypothetical protein
MEFLWPRSHCVLLLLQILAVNGTPIVNLPHLAQIVTSSTSDYLCFDCDYNETIVINRQQATAGTNTGNDTYLLACGWTAV